MAEITQNSGSRRGSTHRVSTRIDMTPLVDLGFLLITFFMLATTFSKPKALEINMPDKSTNEVQDFKATNALTLILGKDNQVFYYAGLPEKKTVQVTDFSTNGIRKVLTETKRQNPDLLVVVKISNAARYKNLVDVLDEMPISGNTRYAIADFTKADQFLLNP